MSVSADPSSSTGSKSRSCNNKIGKNQYKDRPAPNDPLVSELLRGYHSKGITDRTQVSKLLLEEHGITLGESSISRRKRKLGLKASHLTTLELDVNVKRQLILDQMAKDPKGRLGARMVKQGILRDTGIHLTRDYIREEMRNLDPVGHAARGPAHVKAKRQQKQLAAQAGCTIQPSGSHPDVNPSHTPTQTVSSDLPSSSPRYQLHPIPLLPVPHSPMNVDEDSDSSSTGPHFNPEIPDQLNIPPSSNVNPAPEADAHPLHDTLPPGPPKTVTSPSITAALDILRDIAPQMSSITRMLGTLDMTKEALDVQSLSLVTGGMEAAALLERQLARVASKAQCY